MYENIATKVNTVNRNTRTPAHLRSIDFSSGSISAKKEKNLFSFCLAVFIFFPAILLVMLSLVLIASLPLVLARLLSLSHHHHILLCKLQSFRNLDAIV